MKHPDFTGSHLMATADITRMLEQALEDAGAPFAIRQGRTRPILRLRLDGAPRCSPDSPGRSR